MITPINIISLFVIIVIVLYWLIKRNYSYWKNIGAPYIQPTFPYGSLTKDVGTKYNICELLEQFYQQKKGEGPFVGAHYFLSRVVIAIDLDFIKTVMVREFNAFNDRGYFHNERDEPLTINLFSSSGSKWKQLRTKLTPTFTSGKMKFMFPTMIEIGERLQKRFNELIAENKEFEIKNIWARYSTDVIGSCAYGIECNTLNGQNESFRDMGRRIFDEPRHSLAIRIFMERFETLARLLGVTEFPTEQTDFFMKVVTDTIAYRKQSSIQRNDFMSLLINLKESTSSSYSKNNNNNNDGLTTNEIAAQAFTFFLAGFETSSTLLTFCSYELSVNQEIQDRTRREIKIVLEKHNGQFTYEAMMEMKYVDQVLNETLRKYPPVLNLTRVAFKDYRVSNTNYVIPAGTRILIPAYAIHRDPDFYPEPEKFDPDRFSDIEIAKRNPYTFLAFGEGPRNCIGLRFGMMQARIGLIMMLLKCKFKLSNKMKIPIKLTTNTKFIGIEGGLWLNIEKLPEDL